MLKFPTSRYMIPIHIAGSICRSLNMGARVMLDPRHDLDLSKRYVEESLRLVREASFRSQEAQARDHGHYRNMQRRQS